MCLKSQRPINFSIRVSFVDALSEVKEINLKLSILGNTFENFHILMSTLIHLLLNTFPMKYLFFPTTIDKDMCFLN